MQRIFSLNWSETTCECAGLPCALYCHCIYLVDLTVFYRKTVSTFTLSKIDNIMRLLLEGEKKVFMH